VAESALALAGLKAAHAPPESRDVERAGLLARRALDTLPRSASDQLGGLLSELANKIRAAGTAASAILRVQTYAPYLPELNSVVRLRLGEVFAASILQDPKDGRVAACLVALSSLLAIEKKRAHELQPLLKNATAAAVKVSRDDLGEALGIARRALATGSDIGRDHELSRRLTDFAEKSVAPPDEQREKPSRREAVVLKLLEAAPPGAWVKKSDIAAALRAARFKVPAAKVDAIIKRLIDKGYPIGRAPTGSKKGVQLKRKGSIDA
jgi:hypothetical protein